MKSATIPTIVAGFALAGVVLLFFRQLDADVRPTRQQSSGPDDSTVRMAALERRITQLEQELELVRSDRPAHAERVPAPERRTASNTPEEGSPESESRRSPSPDGARPSRQATQLGRLATDGKITKLTAAQLTQVEEKYAGARKRISETMNEFRNNPANEGLEREARVELMRTELTALRQEFENELAAFLPPNDAQVIAQELMSNRGGRNRGRGRRGRGGGR